MKLFFRIMRALPALFITACSWYLSSLPKIEQMPQFWNADKLVHCICFAGLAFWTAFALDTHGSTKRRIAFPSALVALYAIIDEIHQHFTPGRTCDAVDWLFDATGAVCGSIVFLLCLNCIYRWKRKKAA